MTLDLLLRLQGAELDRLSDEAAARVLEALEDSRRLLLESLSSVGEVTASDKAQRLRVSLYQAELGALALRDRLGAALSEGERIAREASVRHMLAILEHHGERFPGARGLDLHIVERLSRKGQLGLHRYASHRYGTQVLDAVQRELVVGVAANLGQAKIAERIAGIGSDLFRPLRGRAELIARTELCRAYNDSELEAILEVAENDPRPDDPMQKRIEEYLDARNHPFSRVSEGLTVPPDQNFRVPVALVASAAKQMKKSPKGVLWPEVGGFYTGSNLPAHFGERGRIIGWRSSWGAS